MTDFALRKRKFWTCVGAEFLATTIFVFAVSSSTLTVQGDATVVVLHVSLTAGLTVATLVMATGHLTGGLINPALTTALMATKKISVLEGVFYIVAQFLGGRYTDDYYKFSRLSVIRTFKENWKRFELWGVNEWGPYIRKTSVFIIILLKQYMFVSKCSVL